MKAARRRWRQAAAEPWLIRITGTVMVVDALLLSVHVAHRSVSLLDPDGRSFPLLRSDAVWNGGMDGSVMELFGLLQLGAAALLFLLRGILAPGHRVLAAWGAVFLLLAVDDLFRIHERVGARLGMARAVPSLGETAAQELGGLIFWAVSGVVLVGGLINAHCRNAPASRSVSWAVLATVAPFALVAVGYVLFSAVRPELVHGSSGEAVATARMAVKLITMTLVLVAAMRLSTFRP